MKLIIIPFHKYYDLVVPLISLYFLVGVLKQEKRSSFVFRARNREVTCKALLLYRFPGASLAVLATGSCYGHDSRNCK